jgi:predicted flap endonuclease-1-like 5' DNA nuclease
MKVLRVFFLGLVYGFLMRWVLDKIYLEENLRNLSNDNALLRQRIQSLETPFEALSVQPEAAGLPVEETGPVPEGEPGPVPPHRDDLKMIKGIGPKMEQKLNDAGVYTFDQMSRLTAAQLQAVLGLSKKVVQSSDNYISQAKKLAEEGPKG